MRILLAVSVLLAAGCGPRADEKVESVEPEIPYEAQAAVMTAMPGVTITGGQAGGAGEYEVTGTLNGQEYEFDLMGPDGSWRVVEIQRDIAWGDAPAPVRNVVATAPNAFLPERVIESRQPGGDGSVVYELFAPGQADAPTIEVRFMDGEAAILPPAH
ncbi:MAG: hypothetical protein ACT4OF_02895 [Caulobacteraceae bacterium]